MKSERYSIVNVNDDLISAERELRNRRFIAEADAVKMAREVVLPIILSAYEKNGDKDEEEGLHSG